MNVLQRLAHARTLERLDARPAKPVASGSRSVLRERFEAQARPPDPRSKPRPAPSAGFECRRFVFGSGPRPPILGGCLAQVESPGSTRLARDLACLGVDEASRPAVLDIESTGLAGAAFAFVIGVAWPRGDQVEVRQWVLTRVSAEASMLASMLGALRHQGAGPLMSFNGASFDLPLLRLRAQRHGLDASVLSGAHVDVLHGARRVYRGEFDDCRLSTLERRVLGIHRHGDIDGAEIPQVFWDLVGEGRPTPQARARLEAVCDHNLVDILSLPALACDVAEQLRTPANLARARRAARHWLGLGVLGQARRVLSSWVEPGMARPRRDRAPGWRAAALELAILERRARGPKAAADLWRAAWQDDPGCPGASEAWAKYLEHHVGDFGAALGVARGSRLPCPRRISRLERRAGAASSTTAPAEPSPAIEPAPVAKPELAPSPPDRADPIPVAAQPRARASVVSPLLEAIDDERGATHRYRLLV